jgi:hypothetical protein
MGQLVDIRTARAGPEADPHGKRKVLDVHGNHIGTVSDKSSAAVAARIAGHPNVKLAEVDGEQAWRAFTPNRGRPHLSAVPLDVSLRQAKGSVTKHPTKSQTTARPKR